VKKQAWKCLSGSSLKVMAMLTMLIDHLGCYLLNDIPSMNVPLFDLWGISPTIYSLCRTIGRTAFPLYAFLLVEGFTHTRDKRKYGLNLFIFALVSEIPWNLVHSGTWLHPTQNVFFTLFLGFCGLYMLEHLKSRPLILVAGITSLLAFAWIFRADYDFIGIGVILCLYLLREHSILRLGIGVTLLRAGWRATPAFVLMEFYNGKRGFIQGRAGKYICYAFYPFHLVILWILKYHVLH